MAQIEYDDSGSTTSYFILSIYLLVLLPVSYVLLPKKKKQKGDGGTGASLTCHCSGCFGKAQLLEDRNPKTKIKAVLKYGGLLVAWLFFFFLVYRVYTMERTITLYDPYEILEVDRGASVSEIRRQYRELSKIYHPDKEGGDSEKFMRIAKAYEALTDEESRKNWEEYGNPDGPQAATFGIALPSWIVDKKNSGLVLGLYVLVFMVALPAGIGTWWYKSVKYTSANILMDTQRVFFYFLTRMNTVPVKRIIEVEMCALEFTKDHSVGVQERPLDNELLPQLIPELPRVNAKTKERPFCAVYATKARILMHAHLSRLALSPAHGLDLYYVLKIAPKLIQEMLNLMQQAWIMYHYQRPKDMSCPSIDSFENVMRLSGMTVQALWDTESVFMQLPHIEADVLRHFYTKRRHVKTIEDLAHMKDADRQSLLRTLTPEDYHDIMSFLAQYPSVAMSAAATVEDDHDVTYITAGAVVTVNVELTRKPLLENYKQSVSGVSGDVDEETPVVEDNEDSDQEVFGARNGTVDPEIENMEKKMASRVWEVNKRRKKGGKPAKKGAKQPVKKKKHEKKSTVQDEDFDVHSHSPKRASPQLLEDTPKEPKLLSADDGLRQRGKANERVEEEEEPINNGPNESEAKDKVDEEEEEWSRLQKNMKTKSPVVDTAAGESHIVHCPYFPLEKQECWWMYVVDKKAKRMICLPQKVTGLVDTKTVTAQFSAPQKPCRGVEYTVILRSDSYLDLKVEQRFKMTVYEPKTEVVEKQQWKDLEEEEEEEEAFEETEDEEDSEEDSGTDD